MNTHLFKFAPMDRVGDMPGSDYGAGSGAAPKLLHVGQNSAVDSGNQETYVDVLGEFPWSNSPDRATRDSPYMDLIERRITMNPMVNQMATHLAVFDNIGQGAELSESQKQNLKSQLTEMRDPIESGESAFSIKGGAMEVASGLAKSVQEAKDPMGNYSNLYTTTNTGWRYRLPYYTDSYKSLMNQFTTNKGQLAGGVGGGALDILAKGGNIAAQAGKAIGGTFMGPGSYIETSKFFSFEGRERTYQFNFPLSNSIHESKLRTQEQVITRNWELIYLLVYQNSPNRITRDLVIPPCIYTARVPGVFYSPYAYISDITVEFIGTRRMMTLSVPSYNPLGGESSRHDIQTIVPDIYGVTIAVTELHGEAQNMLWQAATSSNLITTS